MKRRELLSAGLNSSVLAAVAALDAGERLMQHRVVQQGADKISTRMDALEARFDRLEHHQKNLVREGALAFTLSTGIDVLTIL